MLPAPSTICASLPLDISEAIVEYLHTDRLTLYACSLTCKTWAHMCRKHMFAKIQLYPWNFHKFLPILQSNTNPGQYVRKLTLNEGRARFKVERRWVRDALPELAASLYELKELCISQMDWHLLDDAARSAILSGFKEVYRLQFQPVVFDTVSQCLEFIASFPRLEFLLCDSVALREEYPAGQVRAVLSLHTVYLGACPKEHFVKWLLTHESPIHTVRLNLVRGRESECIGKLLLKCGSTLRELRIGLSWYEQEEAEKILTDHINLVHNTSLRSIHLEDIVIYTDIGHLMSHHWISIILSQIISYEMEEVLFILWLNMVDELDIIDWAGIEEILCQPHFSGLSKVTIHVYGLVDRMCARGSLIERLPVLHARGLIRVK